MIRNVVKRQLSRRGYKVIPLSGGDPSFFEGVLHGLLAREALRPLTIVQIGANDGVTNDPLHDALHRFQSVRALLIEPQPGPSEELLRYYHGDDRIVVETCAISAEEDTISLFTVPSKYRDEFAGFEGRNHSGVASQNRDHVADEIAKRLRVSRRKAVDMVEELVVPAKRIEDVLRLHGFEYPDVVQVDVEGLDDCIVMAFDLDNHRPAVINYEIKHLPLDRYERLASSLDSAGYRRVPYLGDECAVLAP